jgi:soluble lytic murein transglycosylase-like protein
MGEVIERIIFYIMSVVAFWAVCWVVSRWIPPPAEPYVPSIDIPAADRIQLDDLPDARVIAIRDFIGNYNPDLDDQTAESIADAIIASSDALSLDYRDLTAVLAIESHFRVDPVNILCKDATGIGQVRTTIWAKHLIKRGIINHTADLQRVGPNVRASAYILNHYRRGLEIDERTLRAYNGAPDNCNRYVDKFNRVRRAL